jgi:electron transfer flavoprotein beta subunit
VKILVCVKQVLETEQAFGIDEMSLRVKTYDRSEYRMNRFDEFAIEEAIRLKEKHPNILIDLITVGPDRTSAVIKRGIGMGADRGILIRTEKDDYLSPFATAALIFSYAKTGAYDLVLTGVMSEDDMHCQVGPLIGGFLDWPCATSVVHHDVSFEKQTISVEREIEGGARALLELDLPAVLTIQSSINQPRYPSLSNLLRAKREKIETVDSESLAPMNPRQKLVRLMYPEKRRSGIFLQGNPEEKAENLVQVLREKNFI